MVTIACVLRSGGRYDAGWAQRLAAGARRFVPGLERFVCLTDAGPIAGVETIALRHDWPAWWAKFEVFRPDLFDGATVLCDLDTVFAGDASALAASSDLTVLEDYFHRGRVSSALMRFEAGTLGFLYEAFAADPARWMAPGSCGEVPNAVHGDQVVIDHLLRREGQAFATFQQRHPGLVDFYDPAKTQYGPIVVFIGDSKPDGAGEPIATLWREAREPARTDRR